MENEYLNPGFENYNKEKRSDDYVFMNEELTPEGAKFEPLDNLKTISDNEINEVRNSKRIVSITNHLSDEQSKIFLFATASVVVTLGTIFSLIANKDLTSSITNEITYLGGFDKFKDAIATLTTGNIIGMAGSAILWIQTIKHGMYAKELGNILNSELDKQSIDFLEVNEAKEEVTEGRTR